MKTLKIIVLTFLALIVLVILGVFVLLKTIDLNKYLPGLIQPISHSIGRTIGVGNTHLDFSFTRGVVIALQEVTLGNDLKPETGNLLRADTVDIVVDLMPLLTRRQIHLTKAFITSIQILQKPLQVTIKNIEAKIDFDFKNLTIKDLHASVGETGVIQASGIIYDLLSLPRYDFQIEIKAVSIEDLLEQSAWKPIVLKGSLTSQFSGSGVGFNPDTMLDYLKAEGNITVVNARIENFNILNAILSKVNFIPGMGEQLASFLPGSLKSKLGDEATVLDKIQAKLHWQDKVLLINDGQMESKLFSLMAQGKAGLDLTVDMDIKAYLASDLSADLVNAVKPLEALLDHQKRIYIPGKVAGQIPSIKFSPQLNDAAKKAMINEGVNQLDKILDKNPKIKNILNSVLGGSDAPEISSESQSSSNSESSSEDKPAKKLINDLLNKYLK